MLRCWQVTSHYQCWSQGPMPGPSLQGSAPPWTLRLWSSTSATWGHPLGSCSTLPGKCVNKWTMLQTPVLSYLDAHVARVDAHHKTDEEVTAIACHQAEQHQAQQTWDGSRVTQYCTTVWPQTCYTIRWDLHLMKLSWDGSLVSLVSTITLWAIFR